MSGGSFDYVCYDMGDPEAAYRATRKLQDMKSYCEAAHPEAVPYIEDMLHFISRFHEEYLEKGARIADLLKSIEWYVSSDWSASAVDNAINKLEKQDEGGTTP